MRLVWFAPDDGVVLRQTPSCLCGHDTLPALRGTSAFAALRLVRTRDAGLELNEVPPTVTVRGTRGVM